MEFNLKTKKLLLSISTIVTMWGQRSFAQEEHVTPPDPNNMDMVDKNQATPPPPPPPPPPANMPPPPPASEAGESEPIDVYYGDSEYQSADGAVSNGTYDQSAGSMNGSAPAAPAAQGQATTPPKPIKPKIKEKVLSNAEKTKICNKYQNKVISYYSEVFKVEKCKRITLNAEEVYSYTKVKNDIITVDANAMIALPLKKVDQNSKERVELVVQSNRSCEQLNGKYVSYKYGDVYYVEKCKKRSFDYWGDYEIHRDTIGKGNKDILPLSDKEFVKIKDGSKISSKLNDAYWRTVVQTGIDTIPVDEACLGLEGKYVTYYDQVYKIEKCRKREIVDVVTKSKKLSEVKLRELSSEQWISLPNGKKISKE